MGSTRFLTEMSTEEFLLGVERVAASVVPNAKLRTEARTSFPTLSLHDFLKDSFFTL